MTKLLLIIGLLVWAGAVSGEAGDMPEPPMLNMEMPDLPAGEGGGKDGHFSALYIGPGAVNLYVDKQGSDADNCTEKARCLTINRALKVAPSIAGGINIFIGAGVYRESIKLIGFPLSFGTRISFIGTFNPVTGIPETVIDNENVRPFAFQVQKAVQAQIKDIKIINVVSGQSAIMASEHVYLYLFNVHVTAPTGKDTICIQAKTNSRIYSKRTNIDGCNIGLAAVNSSVLSAGYSLTIPGTFIGLTDENNSKVLTDAALKQAPGRLVGARLDNTTDGSSCRITANDSTSVTCREGLAGGRRNYWSNGDSYAVHDGSDSYSGTTWAGLYYAENASGVVRYSYFSNNTRAMEVRAQSRANLVGNTFLNNKIAVSVWDGSTIYDTGGNNLSGNDLNFDIRTGSTYGSPSITHSVPCVVSADCSKQTGPGYCCWNSRTRKLYFGDGGEAVEVGR
ncbi:MAG: hypothetical protein HZB33_10325 [Nitrospirae bacterium]|nr:hypothetical protein [Nitrospirota bacterium]